MGDFDGDFIWDFKAGLVKAVPCKLRVFISQHPSLTMELDGTYFDHDFNCSKGAR